MYMRHGVYGPDVSRCVLQSLVAGGFRLHELAVLLEAEAQLPPNVTINVEIG